MNNHLSPEQFSNWLLGQCTPEELEHGRQCVECSAELRRLKETLSLFRDSVRNWADRQGPVAPDAARVLEKPAGFRSSFVRWAVASAALAMAAGIPVYNNNADRQRDAQTAADELLLDQVNMHLSRTVPAAMEPFLELISEEPASSETNNGEPR